MIQSVPLFFGKDISPLGCLGKFNFSPGGPPLSHMTPQNTPFWQFFRYFQIRGVLEEKLGRQEKDTQNACNEPNFPPPELWAPNITCWKEIRVSKSEIVEIPVFLNISLEGDFNEIAYFFTSPGKYPRSALSVCSS